MIKMHDLLLSIVIPTYNCESYIDECLHSVLSQLPSNCELVLVDDGSKDATCSVLEAYRNEHKNLKIIKMNTRALLRPEMPVF